MYKTMKLSKNRIQKLLILKAQSRKKGKKNKVVSKITNRKSRRVIKRYNLRYKTLKQRGGDKQDDLNAINNVEDKITKLEKGLIDLSDKYSPQNQ